MNSIIAFPSSLTLFQLLFVIWLSGCLLLAVLSVLPPTAERASTLWRLMLTEAVILMAFVVPLTLGPIFAAVGLVLLAARTGWESGHVNGLRSQVNAEMLSVTRIQAGMLCVVIVLGSWLTVSLTGLSPPVMASISLALMPAVLSIRAAVILTPLQQVAILPGVPLFAIAALVSDSYWYPALIIAFLFVESFDCFALLGGKLFGRRHIFPTISPHKTLEGLLTGLLGLSVVAAGANTISFHWNWGLLFSLLVVCSLVAVAGDLAASVPKRAAGVKDYPPVDSQNGGLLDIADSWLVAAPVFCVALWLINRWFS
jgi:phosphatidate cytidylyltransferase